MKRVDRLKQHSGVVLLSLSAQLHGPSNHAAIDATFFDRESASKHYCRRTNYRAQTLKTTALVDTESQVILEVHWATEKRHDIYLSCQVASRNAGDLASLGVTKTMIG